MNEILVLQGVRCVHIEETFDFDARALHLHVIDCSLSASLTAR